MTTSTYHAEFRVDRQYEEPLHYRGNIQFDKHTPNLLEAQIGELKGGILGFAIWSAKAKNTVAGQAKLVKLMKEWATVDGLTLVSEETTEYAPGTGRELDGNNPRFVWNIGAIKEQFRDMPEQNGADTVLYDRQERRDVVTLHGVFGQLICLEHNEHGTPFTDLENWINSLENEDLTSENIPASKPEWTKGGAL